MVFLSSSVVTAPPNLVSSTNLGDSAFHFFMWAVDMKSKKQKFNAPSNPKLSYWWKQFSNSIHVLPHLPLLGFCHFEAVQFVSLCCFHHRGQCRDICLKILEQRDSWLLAGALPAGLRKGCTLAFPTSLVPCVSFASEAVLDFEPGKLSCESSQAVVPGWAELQLGPLSPACVSHTAAAIKCLPAPGLCHLLETRAPAAFQGWAKLQHRPSTSSFVGLQIILCFQSSQDLCFFF